MAELAAHFVSQSHGGDGGGTPATFCLSRAAAVSWNAGTEEQGTGVTDSVRLLMNASQGDLR